MSCDMYKRAVVVVAVGLLGIGWLIGMVGHDLFTQQYKCVNGKLYWVTNGAMVEQDKGCLPK